MLSLLLAAAVAFTPDPKDPRQRQLAAMAEELERAYKKALSAFLRKKGKQVYRPDDPETPPSFSREESQVAVDPPLPFPFDRAGWVRELRGQTERLGAHPELFDSHVRVSVDHEEREF